MEDTIELYHERVVSNPYLAALLSLMVPGLGQVFNRQLGKGLAVFLLSFLIVPYVYGVVDAFLVAKKRRDPQFPNHRRPLVLPARKTPKKPSMEVVLVRTAERLGGDLTVKEGMAATGKKSQAVEVALDALCLQGRMDIANREDTGEPVYRLV